MKPNRKSVVLTCILAGIISVFPDTAISFLHGGSEILSEGAEKAGTITSEMARGIRNSPAPVFVSVAALGVFGILFSVAYGKWSDVRDLRRDKEKAQKLVEYHALTRVNRHLGRWGS